MKPAKLVAMHNRWNPFRSSSLIEYVVMSPNSDGTYFNNLIDRNVSVTWDGGKTFAYY